MEVAASAEDAPRRRAGRVRDPMVTGTWRSANRLPKRIVVELTAQEWETIEAACRGRCVTAPELVRLVALRLARVV